MKNFSFRLFKQGLKRVRVMGFCALLVCVVLNIMTPLSSLVEYYSSLKYSDYVLSEITVNEGLFIPSMFLIFIFAPLIVISIFSFLNKRNSSDFYHAIPYKRENLYLSYMAAALTWVAGIIIVSTAINTVLWTIVPHASFSWIIILKTPAVYFIAAMMLAGFAAIAMSITGNHISNLLLTVGLALFLRVIFLEFLMGIESATSLANIEAGAFSFFGWRYYLPLSIFIDSATGAYYFGDNPFNDIGPIIYTLIISVLLIVLGMFLFKKRKSEMATHSAPNRKMQHFYRICATIPFAGLTAIAAIASIQQSGYMNIGLISSVIITVLVYALYELITTKKILNVIKSLPMFLIVILFAGLFTGSIFVSQAYIYSSKIEPADVKSISLESDVFERWEYEKDSDMMNKRFSTEDERVKELACLTLKENIEAEKEKFENEDMNYGWNSTKMIFELNNGRKVERNVILKEETEKEITRILFKNTEVKEKIINLPKEIEYIALNVTEDMPNSFMQKVWDDFLLEYNNMTEDEKVEFALESRPWNIKETSEKKYFINATGEEDGIMFSEHFYITKNMFPEFVEKYEKYLLEY